MRPVQNSCSEIKPKRVQLASDILMDVEKRATRGLRMAKANSGAPFKRILASQAQLDCVLDDLSSAGEVDSGKHLKGPQVVLGLEAPAKTAGPVVPSSSSSIACITSQRDFSSRRAPAAVFETIESAQQYLALLAEVVVETHRDAEAALQSDMRSSGATQQASLQVLVYDLKKLANFLDSSNRVVQDLLLLRHYLKTEDSKAS